MFKVCSVFGVVYICLTAALVWLGATLFEYSLMCLFGRDVPWWLDVLGGLAINGFSVPLAIGCYIATACGVATPFIQ